MVVGGASELNSDHAQQVQHKKKENMMRNHSNVYPLFYLFFFYLIDGGLCIKNGENDTTNFSEDKPAVTPCWRSLGPRSRRPHWVDQDDLRYVGGNFLYLSPLSLLLYLYLASPSFLPIPLLYTHPSIAPSPSYSSFVQDTVNIASMCTVHGKKNGIQVTKATFSQLHTFTNFHADPSLLSLSPSAPPLSTHILTGNPEEV